MAALLSKGSVISISKGNQPISSVLDQIEKDTGNRIDIMGDFGRVVGDGGPSFDSKGRPVPEKQISLDLQKKSFWEVADAVAVAADAKFDRIATGRLTLRSTGPQFGGNQFGGNQFGGNPFGGNPFGGNPFVGKPRAVGPTTVVGAFQVYPAYNDSFHHALIAIRPEPRLERPQVRSYTAEITLPDDTQIEYKPDMMGMTFNVHSGELALPITPNLPRGAEKAKKIKVEAHLAVASDWKEFTLPPLGELMPQPTPVGRGIVYVTKTIRSERMEWSKSLKKSVSIPTLTVSLLAKGLSFNLSSATLIDPAGNEVKSPDSSPSREKSRQYVSLSFPLATISGDPDKCRLAFKIPGKEEKTDIGPISDLLPKTISVGAAKMRVTMAQIEKQGRFGALGQPESVSEEFGFCVKVEFDGIFTPRQDTMLVGSNERPLKLISLGRVNDTTEFWFDNLEMTGKPESFRLRIQAPTKVTEFVLRASFEDVPLTREYVARR